MAKGIKMAYTVMTLRVISFTAFSKFSRSIFYPCMNFTCFRCSMLSWINSLEMSCLPDGADKKAIISDQGRQLPVKLAPRRNRMDIQLQEQA
jgi:hypothetical protein